MNPEAFKLDVAVDDSVVVVTWTRLRSVPDIMAVTRYPKLEMRFNYRDISTDTVMAMLRDMDVPDPLSKGIMTRIAANAN